MLSAGARIGPYEILTPIGAGGMGEVYRARDTRLDREVAIKILQEQLAINPSALKRFEREAKAVAALSHPNILDIHEFDTQGGISFVVTELLNGETLRQRIARSPIPLEKGLEIAVGVAEGLAAAHSKGVIHRDLKPENIFLTNDGHVKILDFGLAKLKPIFSEQELTQAETKSVETEDGIIRGTVPYMSPEQVRGAAVDARTDIFSFGCILHEMLTSKRPFSGETAADTMSAILKEEPAIKEAPVPLQEVVRHCLEKNPDQRFHSAHDLAFALKAVLSGLEVARPEQVKRVSRRTVWIATAVFGVIVLVAGFLLWRKLLPSSAPSGRIGSIAVLPMANLSDDPQQEYFSDGMTDALITDLARIKALRVISRSSVMQYKGTKKPMPQIAKELNVDAVVEGSVLRSGNRVRITAQLIDATTDAHVWAQAYERDLRDILALQSDVARAIVNEINVQLTPQEERHLSGSSPVNSEAHEAYLRGEFYRTNQRKKAIEYFSRAVEIDAKYAKAWAGLAEAYAAQGLETLGVDPRETISKAKIAATNAIQLDPNLGAAHMALGLIHLLYDWDWPEAEKELRIALDLSPSDVDTHHWYSHLMIVLGREEESLTSSLRAVQLDPLNALMGIHLGWHFLQTREYDRAVEACLKVLDVHTESVGAYDFLAQAYAEKGLFQKAIEAEEKAVQISQRNPLFLTRLGFIYARAGQRQEALKILKELKEIPKEQYFAFYDEATIHAAMYNRDQAFVSLEKAYEFHSAYLPYLKVDPRVDSLRSDPRFDDLIRRVGIP